eukprot:755848-Hanusia_phi.AAC.5
MTPPFGSGNPTLEKSNNSPPPPILPKLALTASKYPIFNYTKVGTHYHNRLPHPLDGASPRSSRLPFPPFPAPCPAAAAAAASPPAPRLGPPPPRPQTTSDRINALFPLRPLTKMSKGEQFDNKSQQDDVRRSNIMSAKGKRAKRNRFVLLMFLSAIADAVRTSLGPRGMDKMVSLRSARVKCDFWVS